MMYIPPFFEETEVDEIKGLIAAYPLATLVAHTTEGILASHIPLIAEDEGALIGHFAADNDMSRLINGDDEVLAIFKGEDAYISPNWYPSKQEHHKQVPTWNYQVVHVYGKLRVDESVKFRRKVVGLLSRHFERKTNGDAAWKMADAPKDYIDDLLDKIVCFEIEITRTLAKSKLNQNKSDADIRSVKSKLHQAGKAALVKRMDRFPPKG